MKKRYIEPLCSFVDFCDGDIIVTSNENVDKRDIDEGPGVDFTTPSSSLLP